MMYTRGWPALTVAVVARARASESGQNRLLASCSPADPKVHSVRPEPSYLKSVPFPVYLFCPWRSAEPSRHRPLQKMMNCVHSSSIQASKPRFRDAAPYLVKRTHPRGCNSKRRQSQVYVQRGALAYTHTASVRGDEHARRTHTTGGSPFVGAPPTF